MKVIGAIITSLVLVGLFAAFANWVPQVGWSPPKVEVLTADISPAQLAKVGETIVKTRGCLICHTVDSTLGRTDPSRAPNLYGIGGRRPVNYILDSLYEPNKEVVQPYPPIMPPVTGPPSNLKYEEVVAVVNYLQSLGGTPAARIGQLPRPSQTTVPGDK